MMTKIFMWYWVLIDVEGVEISDFVTILQWHSEDYVNVIPHLLIYVIILNVKERKFCNIFCTIRYDCSNLS